VTGSEKSPPGGDTLQNTVNSHLSSDCCISLEKSAEVNISLYSLKAAGSAILKVYYSKGQVFRMLAAE